MRFKMVYGNKKPKSGVGQPIPLSLNSGVVSALLKTLNTIITNVIKLIRQNKSNTLISHVYLF